MPMDQKNQNLIHCQISHSTQRLIVLEHTEAMHVIDVNSRTQASVSIQTAASRSNTTRSWEIARQLRLRDIGGLIIIDFIDMKKQWQQGRSLQQNEEFMGSRIDPVAYHSSSQ